jgi:hypothetical protein
VGYAAPGFQGKARLLLISLNPSNKWASIACIESLTLEVIAEQVQLLGE